MAKTFLGLSAGLFNNTGTYGTPVFTAITNVKDLKLMLDSDKADASTRGNGGWGATVATLKKAGLAWGMIYDTTDATGWAVMQAAWLAGTPLDLFVLDGPATTGAQGLRASFTITKFEIVEDLAGIMTTEVEAEPTYAANAPAWYTHS